MRIVLLIIAILITENLLLSQAETYVLKILPVDNNAKLELNNKKTVFRIKDSISIYKKLHKIKDKWKQKGYFLTNIDTLTFKGNNVEGFLFLGFKILNISLLSNNISADLLKKSGIKNNIIHRTQLKFYDFIKIRKKLINHLENTGYPFAQISIDSLIIEKNKLSGKLRLQKNSLIKIHSIIYKGKPKISQKFIDNHIFIKKGDLYNQSKIDGITNNLEKLPYINLYKAPEIEFRDNKADIYLYLKTKKANYFNGLIGFYYDDNKNLKTNGDIDISLNNNFKIGENIGLKWNKYGKEAQKVYLTSSFPYIFILPIGINLGFSLEKYELDYLNTDLNAALSHRFSSRNKIEIYFSNKKSLPINQNETISDFKTIKNYRWGIKFIYNSTDYFFNPRKGIYINAASGFGYRKIDDKKLQISDFKTETAFYIKLGKISTIALINKSAAMFSSSDLYINELYKIGGSNILRGFNQNSIYASLYSVFSIEPRLLIGKNSAVYLFFDYAYYQSKTNNIDISDRPFGFGLGLNIDTKAGIFRLAYALGKQFDNHIKFSNSKVHFGFAVRF